MRLLWWGKAWDQYVSWLADDPGTARRVNELIKDVRRSPFVGIGKPEPLRGELAGWWSRRITREHRLIYRVTGGSGEQVLEIVSCRFHY